MIYAFLLCKFYNLSVKFSSKKFLDFNFKIRIAYNLKIIYSLYFEF